MKKSKISVMSLVVLAGLTIVGCKDNKAEALQKQLDSLANVDSLRAEDVTSMAQFIQVMSDGMDSIAAQEGIVRKSSNPEGKRIDKETLKTQLSTLNDIVKRQREHIAELEQKLSSSNSSYSQRVKKLIAYYKQQLDEKEAKIAELQAELDKKNADIAKLNDDITALNTTNTQLNNTVAEQQTVMNAQDETIHEAYVQIGTSKELKNKGLLTGGFLAKKKIDVSKLKSADFSKIDIRNYNDINLNSKKPQIMTQMPAGSYEITQNVNGTSTLHIKDVNKFWSVSKFLVIKL